MNDRYDPEDRSGRGFDSRWILGGFIVVAAFFLFTEHRAHLFGYLPFLLLLACPLMHLFHRHGGHRRDDSRGGSHDHTETRR